MDTEKLLEQFLESGQQMLDRGQEIAEDKLKTQKAVDLPHCQSFYGVVVRRLYLCHIKQILDLLCGHRDVAGFLRVDIRVVEFLLCLE